MNPSTIINSPPKGHIKPSEQKEIYLLLEKGYNKSDIAIALQRSHTSIGREIKRNLTKGKYDPLRAAQKARNRRMCSKYQGMKVQSNPELKKYIIKKLKLLWTPEDISGTLKVTDTHITYISAKGMSPLQNPSLFSA